MSKFALEPYIHFNGNCTEALAVYAKLFSGAVTTQMTFEQGPANSVLLDSEKSWIMHANFKADGVNFMASDCPSAYGPVAGNNMNLCITMTDEDEQTRVFEALSAGGVVKMPLMGTFWGARFGMLTDRFGVNWMLIVQPS